MIEVVAYTPENQNRWNQFVEAAKNGHFMFDRGYMEYHSDRFADRSLIFLKNNRVVALLPGHAPTSGDCDGLISHGGLSFGGIISGRSMNASLMLEVVDALIAHLRENGWSYLDYRAMPRICHQYPAEEDLFALSARGATRREIKLGCAIKLGSPPGYSESRKRLLRRAKEEAGQFDIGETADVESFHQLMADFLHRRHDAKPVHSLEELKLLVGRFPKQIKMFAARRGDEWLAATMIFESQTCYRLQYKASSEEGGLLQAPALIEDYLVKEYGKPGRWFDFGTSMVPETGELDASLIQYKESFGARAVIQETLWLEM